MLVALSIRDVVLVDRLSLSFRPGLGILTGETGAGKSILLDALGLALGGRADSALVRAGAAQATATAEFELNRTDHPALALLAEQGLEAGPELVLRRTLTSEGRSRAFINDQPVSAGLLRRVGETLVEVHGQFDSQGLMNPASHRAILDRHAGAAPLVESVRSAHAAWQAAEAAHGTARNEAARARADEEFLRHAADELAALAPRAGEEAELAEARARLMNRERLSEALEAAAGELSGDRGAERALAQALRQLGRIADRAAGGLDPALAALDRAAGEVAEAARLLAGFAADLDRDPRGLEALDDRLHALRAAARKHGVAVDDLPSLQDGIARRLAAIDSGDATLAALAKAAQDAKDAYLGSARRLSAARRGAAGGLDRAVARELAPLKLERARFVTQVTELDEADWGAEGIDRVAFLVATNPGAEPGPIARIASGGERSRFLLALKVVLAASDPADTLIFDEVDAGIGGAVAAAVGERLARLGREMQVLVVTHSPQVAALGAQHWQVRKGAAGAVAVTDVVELDGDDRREEIARMLSGAHITEEARAAAARLMDAGTRTP